MASFAVDGILGVVCLADSLHLQNATFLVAENIFSLQSFYFDVGALNLKVQKINPPAKKP